MKEILQTLLIDFQESELPSGIARRISIKPVPGKATVCIGVRRSGKSTYLFQVIQKLLETGVSRKNILYINFFDDRLHPLQQEGLNSILEAYYGLYPEKKNSEKVYCFFDEIQMIHGWESFVERILRTEKCEVYITGSSAHMLSKDIATTMRGRALSWELFPFSFREFLAYKEIEDKAPYSTKTRLLIQKAFEEYCEVGGFPEVRNIEKHLRIKIHQEYFHAVLFKDLVERHDVSHPKAVSDLAHWISDNIASTYSLNRLYGYLQSLGHKTSKASIAEYLEWFEDAYFFFTVRIFDASAKRAQMSPKKVYCIDHALITSISSNILVNSGHLLENLVFMGLRRLYPHIFYYKTKTGKEVDFLAQDHNRAKQLVQVSETLSSEKTRQREISSLEEAMKELHLPSATIVTKDEEGSLSVSAGNISITPAWKFLLKEEPLTASSV